MPVVGSWPDSPDSTGSLGIAISEAVEDAATRDERRANLIEAVNVQQRAIFEAALSFTGTEGILPAPEPAHARSAR